MCGIVGYMDLRGDGRIDRETLVRMTDTITYRGPDSSGYFVVDNLGLGFRRLSIIDLVSGDQPIYNEDGSLVLICNGEIYNYLELRHELIQQGHTFATRSDVEVLLHLYEEEGEEFVKRLNGQFAFALFDRKKNTLVLARDHFGINPLFYTIVDGLFIFASEIKAILAHPSVPREVDLTGLDQVLSFPGLVSPRTLVRGVSSLKSGHRITVNRARVAVEEYWDLDYPKASECSYDKPESYYIDELEQLLFRSVKLRLQADVPVGFYLSGGLDSSLIGAAIAKVSGNGRSRSFSIGFTDTDICEAKYQHQMARHVNSAHHEIVFDESEVIQRLSDMIFHCECPVKETYNTCSMALSEAVRRAGIKVVLTGEGADEWFAGYVGYRFDSIRARQNKKAEPESTHEAELRQQVWGDKNVIYEIGLSSSQQQNQELYSKAANEYFADFSCLNHEVVNQERLVDRHIVHQRSYLDFKLRLSDHLLSDHGDRMALANSVEARYPFLDKDLVDFARRIPPDLKLRGFTEKYVLKRIAEKFIPKNVVDREKFGFRAPGSPFLLKQNVEWINDLLSYERIKRQGYFNPTVVEALKIRYSRPGFKLNFPFESDYLNVILTHGIFLDLFKMPNFG
jgi:asparagine synthase (glutamine-hydrolyzing)